MQDNCPGPGTYSQDGFKKIDVSFSKRGTGGLASKVPLKACVHVMCGRCVA